MTVVHKRVVIIDRPAWYLPAIEQEEFRKRNAEVTVGLTSAAQLDGDDRYDEPRDEAARITISRITSAYAPSTVCTEEKIISMARGADAILVVKANVTDRIMGALPKLRVIGRCGAGIDNIDIASAKRRNIKVVSAPGYCAREAADHTLMFVLACSRRLLNLHGHMRLDRWTRNTASPMPALYCQSLGLVGFGNVGQEVAKRASSVGLEVFVHDSNLQEEHLHALGVRPAPLNELLSRCDFVSLHVPLTPATRGLVGAAELERMKPTAFLINTSRGEVVDQEALIAALKNEQIAGAALDVFSEEPAVHLPEILKRDNVILTPHVAGLSDESQIMLRRNICRAVADVLDR